MPGQAHETVNEARPKIEQRVFRQIMWAALLLGVALFQIGLAPAIWRFRVDWVLLLVVGRTLLRGLFPGVHWAIYGGLALDFLGALPVGSHLLALLLCVCGVALLAEPLDRDQRVLVLAAMLSAALLYGATLMAVQYGIGRALPGRQYLLVVLIPTALINTIAAIPLFALQRMIARRGQTPIATEFF